MPHSISFVNLFFFWVGQFTHLSFSLKPHTMTNFSLSGGLIGQNIWWHLCGCLEPLIPSERITTQGSENLISSQPLNTCVRVCAHWKLCVFCELCVGGLQEVPFVTRLCSLSGFRNRRRGTKRDWAQVDSDLNPEQESCSRVSERVRGRGWRWRRELDLGGSGLLFREKKKWKV